MTTHRVLITAVGGNVGQGVLKALRASERPFHVIGTDMEPLSAGFSMVDRYYRIPRTAAAGFRSALANIAQQERVDAIYVSSPAELDFFALQKDELQRELGLSIFVNPPAVVRVGADKLETARFLSNAGFAAPETAVSSDEEGWNGIAQRHGFPLIVKPRWGSGSRNVFVVRSADEVRAAATLVPDMVIQQYLPDETVEYTAGTVSGNDRRVRALIILRRVLLQGTTYRTELIEDANLAAQITRVVESLGAVGPCNVQFRVIDGTAYVFEINPRFSGTSGIRYLNGFNDCAMIFDLLHLGIEVRQPVLRNAVVLRYWNEICLPDATFADLREGRARHCGFQTVMPSGSPR